MTTFFPRRNPICCTLVIIRNSCIVRRSSIATNSECIVDVTTNPSLSLSFSLVGTTINNWPVRPSLHPRSWWICRWASVIEWKVWSLVVLIRSVSTICKWNCNNDSTFPSSSRTSPTMECPWPNFLLTPPWILWVLSIIPSSRCGTRIRNLKLNNHRRWTTTTPAGNKRRRSSTPRILKRDEETKVLTKCH